jgi:alpha-tubulin suppressor-like RCC1 family protein
MDKPEVTRTVPRVRTTIFRAGVAGLVAVAAGVSVGILGGGPPAPEVQVSAGSYHTCASLHGDALLCWGLDIAGQLGDGERGSTGAREHVLRSSDAVHVEVGGEHSCFVNGSGELYCWGHNGDGQLGDGTIKQRWSPVRVVNLPFPVVGVSLGRYHSCALDGSALVRCWGRNSNGQLGDGALPHSEVPQLVTDLPVARSVAAGELHTCALLQDGTVACWGDNSSGQLGDGTLESRHTPVTVAGIQDALAVVAGDRHNCALVAAGDVFCWGRNRFRELGTEQGDPRPYPTKVAGVTGVEHLTAGEYHTCALLRTGEVLCWGRNSSGQLGNGEIEDYTGIETGRGPVRVALTGVTRVDAGGLHTCAVVDRLSVYCWGLNGSGQLGYLSAETRPLPYPVTLVPD